MIMINVVLVEDHALIRMGIKALIADMPGIKIVGESGIGSDAIRIIRRIKPHIVLLDLSLPDIGGLEIARRILKYNSHIKVIVLTACANDILPSRLLGMRIAGYLTKAGSTEELSHAINQVYKGQRYISPTIATQLALKNADNDTSPLDVLTDRELEFMIRIAKGDKTKMLAEKFHLSIKTINSYRGKIFKKLNIKNGVDLTRLALQYRLIQSEVLK